MRVCDVSVSFRGSAVVPCTLEDGETPADIVELTDEEIMLRLDISQIAENLEEGDCDIDDVEQKEYDDGR